MDQTEIRHDIDIRNLVLAELQNAYRNDDDTKIINEMGIAHGSSRIDIAVVNGILHGYELKSESDSLKRLPRQAHYYNQLFERMTLVIDRKFLNEASEIVPKWWGISVVSKGYNRMIQIRKGRKVKTKNFELLTSLLWKDELEKLLDTLEYPKALKRYPKNEILELIRKDKNKDIIKKFTYDALKKRDYN